MGRVLFFLGYSRGEGLFFCGYYMYIVLSDPPQAIINERSLTKKDTQQGGGRSFLARARGGQNCFHVVRGWAKTFSRVPTRGGAEKIGDRRSQIESPRPRKKWQLPNLWAFCYKTDPLFWGSEQSYVLPFSERMESQPYHTGCAVVLLLEYGVISTGSLVKPTYLVIWVGVYLFWQSIPCKVRTP